MRSFHIRKAVACLLLFAMLLVMLPVSAFADDPPQEACPEPETEGATTEITTEATESETCEATTVPAGEGSIEANLFQDALGRDYYVFSQANTRGLVQIYKDFYAGIYFDGPSKHGNLPWMSTAYLQADGNGILYTPGQWVYCIDFYGTTSSGSTTTYEDLSQSPIWQGLSAEKKLGITLALSYGAQNGRCNDFYANIATQIIIWEYQIGGRNSAATYSSNAYSPISYASDGNGSYTYCKSQIDTEYSRILAEIANAEAQPSFTENAYTFTSVGSSYYHDFTDSANALSRGVWQVSSCPSELTASIVDGKLRVYANTNFTGEKTITLKRNLYRPTSQAYVCLAGSQWAICGVPDDDTVTIKVSVLQTSTISLRKTAQASSSVLACIQGNPLYTLAGAKYEIHQGSPTGPLMETLTTDANGNASGTVQYNIGTVLYAVETVAPSGYLLNSTPVSLTVSSGNNVFNVSDKPTFDPQHLRIKKTGTDGEHIQGAVFKVDFYASNWMDSTQLKRTWYFQSDSNGIVEFDNAHLLFSYNGHISSALYNPDGGNIMKFPLGCVYVEEVKAADGYVTPVGNEAGVLLFINQPTSGGDAESYWGDAAGKPITTQNPKGIYKMENNSDRTVITAVNRPQARLEIVKTSTDGKVEGITFKVEKEVSGSWTALDTYTTDSSGKILIPNLDPGQKLRITEIVPADYVCTSENPQIITLAEGLNAVSFANKPVARLEIVKTSTDGRVSGISFQVEKEVSGSWTELGTYTTNTSGKIQIPELDVGLKLRITEIVPADYVCTDENPQIITLKKGLNAVSFTNKPVARLEILKTSTDGKIEGISFQVEREVSGSWTVLGTFTTDVNGKINLSDLEVGQKLRITEIVPADYVCTGVNPQIITLKKGLNTVSFSNMPVARLEIVKTSTDGKVEGINFKVEKEVSGSWKHMGFYTTDENGKIQISDLDVGQTLRITETVPADYVCTSENPQVITLKKGLNAVSFANKPVTNLEIVKTSTDGRVSGISFQVEKEVSGSWSLLGTYKTDASGKIQIPELDVGLKLRITEIVPIGYVCTSENPQIITLQKAPAINSVTFNNKPERAIEIIKISPDGKVEGIQFVVLVNGREIGTYTTDANGKISISGLDVGMSVTIAEIVPEGYLCISENPQTITITAEGRNAVRFENEPIFGHLELTKVDEEYPDHKLSGVEFTVTMTLADGSTETAVMEEVLDASGKGTGVYRLNHIAYGTVCEVRETKAPEGYLLSDKEFEVTIQEQKTYVIKDKDFDSVTNRRIYGDLELTKVDEEYPDHKLTGAEFTVTMTKPDGSTETAVMEEIKDASGKGTGVYRLPHIVYGTVCKVKETKAPEGYLLSDKEFEVTIQEQKTYTIADKDFDSVTNRRIYGDLELTKVDEGYPDHKLTGAEFTVTMTKPDGSTETAVMEEELDASGKGAGVYRLEHIAYGTVCEIRETKAPEGYELSDEVWTVTIEEEKTYTIATPDFDAVTNRQKEGKISVHKEDADHNAMSGVQFLLEYSVDDGATWAPVQARTAEDPVAPGYSTSEGLTNGILTTGADGNVVFTGLALSTEINSNVQYRITEIKTQDGKTLLGVSVYNGPLTLDEPDLAYKVVNESVFTMPRTGGKGFAVAGIGIGLCVLTALIILFNLPKKKEEK